MYNALKNHYRFSFFFVFLFFSLLVKAEKDFTKYVDPMIGTNGMGHTFPGACFPFGAVQLSPDTDTIPHNVDGKYQPKVYNYCAGYQYADKTIVGFSHTHFSGTGHSDLGDILLMPTVGDVLLNPGTANHPNSGYRSRFSHDTEKASPGYYEVMLSDYNIKAQLTATKRVGVHKYSYQKGTQGNIILDLNHGIYNYDGKTLWASLRVENDTLITGYRITNGWARTNYVYFAISFSQPINSYGFHDFKKPKYRGSWPRFNDKKNFPEMGGRQVVAYFKFNLEKEKNIIAKVALSAVSVKGAMDNLKKEAENYSFDELRAKAKQTWNKELSSIQAEGNMDQLNMLYTSYYHTLINPSVYMDVDGSYRGLDGSIHKANDHTNYTIFSLWDTYRAEHPFLNLLKPQQNADMVASMIAHQRQSVHHMLPIWSHMGNENWCMSGYHAVTVLADALASGTYHDSIEALNAMVKTSNVPYFDHIDDYRWLGYIPYNVSSTAASTTLEYALDDWAIYSLAKKMGKKQIAQQYKRRALNYRNVFNPDGYACPRYSNGKFKTPFNLLQTYGEGFIEGNALNFSFHVPHDVNGLITMMGGEKKFVQKLDHLFNMELPEEFYEKNEDITKEGLLGGYVHGNEPSHHIPYLYSWTSQPWKTQYWVREIMNKMYKNNIDGLSGNDDCGQMSAWYLFSAMGFYPVCPGSGEFVFGTPYLPYMKIELPNGHVLEIIAPEVSDQKRYVKSVTFNGKKIKELFITYKQLIKGGKLIYEMSERPNKRRGQRSSEKPYSLTNGEIKVDNMWNKYNVGKIMFSDDAPSTEGSKIYHSIIENPQDYIACQARKVLHTLYFSPNDTITKVKTIDYRLKDVKGVSAKSGGNGNVEIFYSTQHIENSFIKNDTAKVDYETRGVLFHELTHAYQLEPKGIGSYGTNKVFWAFIEGMADAVRLANGCFTAADRPKGGSYLDGYRTTGFFFVWLMHTKDPDFLRKMNKSTQVVIPWSFDGAIKYVLGNNYQIDDLWKEYQSEMQN